MLERFIALERDRLRTTGPGRPAPSVVCSYRRPLYSHTLSDKCVAHTCVWQATNTDGDWIFAIVAGAISFALSALVILAHYQIKMLRWLAPGSLAELAVSFVCLCLWMVAVAILARDGGIAANFSSTLGINATANVYYSLWICFFNSVYILSKWVSGGHANA